MGRCCSKSTNFQLEDREVLWGTCYTNSKTKPLYRLLHLIPTAPCVTVSHLCFFISQKRERNREGEESEEVTGGGEARGIIGETEVQRLQKAQTLWLGKQG